MPTVSDSVVISAPEFQQNAFSESGYFRKSRWAGNYEVFVAGKDMLPITGWIQKPGKIVFYLPTQTDLQ